MEHQQLQLFQSCQRPVMDRGDAVEPTGTQNMHLSVTHFLLFLQRCMLPRTPSPKVYTLCV